MSVNPLYESKTGYVPLKEFLQGRSWPTPSSVRYYIFFDKYHFATKCVRRLGRKIFIDVEAYEEWLKEQAK